MPLSKILLCLDADPQPSVFDSVVAIDAGVDQLLRHGGVAPGDVRDLVYGTMFTRGPDDLHNTAVFIGGSDVAAAEELLEQATECFLGPMRVSVMLDANGANTTAAAAVLAAGKHVPLKDAEAVVLAGTGPVGRRAALLLAAEGAQVRVASRSQQRAAQVCEQIGAKVEGTKLAPFETGNDEQLQKALDGAAVVIAAGAPGIQLLSKSIRSQCHSLKVAIDLSAVPPVGIEGIDIQDKATHQNGQICYGAIGVGGTKMKIHKRAVQRLFEANDLVLDAEEIYALGQNL